MDYSFALIRFAQRPEGLPMGEGSVPRRSPRAGTATDCPAWPHHMHGRR